MVFRLAGDLWWIYIQTNKQTQTQTLTNIIRKEEDFSFNLNEITEIEAFIYLFLLLINYNLVMYILRWTSKKWIFCKLKSSKMLVINQLVWFCCCCCCCKSSAHFNSRLYLSTVDWLLDIEQEKKLYFKFASEWEWFISWCLILKVGNVSLKWDFKWGYLFAKLNVCSFNFWSLLFGFMSFFLLLSNYVNFFSFLGITWFLMDLIDLRFVM